MTRVPAIVVVMVLALGAGAAAQNFRRFSRAPLRSPTADSFDGGWNFCRGMFYEFGPNGYALGINAILYALSH